MTATSSHDPVMKSRVGLLSHVSVGTTCPDEYSFTANWRPLLTREQELFVSATSTSLPSYDAQRSGKEPALGTLPCAASQD